MGWRIFTPLLQEIDAKKPQPVLYKFGARVPDGMDDFAKRYGIVMAPNFEERLASFGSLEKIEKWFGKEGGAIKTERLKDLVKEAFDGLEPSEAQMKAIIRKLDVNGDGTIEIDELKAAAVHFHHMFYHEDGHDHSSFDDNSEKH